MKKLRWIVLPAMLLVLAVVVLSLNSILVRIIKAELDHSIAQIDSLDIRYGDVNLLVTSGHVWISDVYVQSDTLYSVADSARQMTRVQVGRVSIDGVNYFKWLTQKRIQVHGITIERPEVTSWFENKDKDEVQNLMGDSLRRQIEAEKALRLEQAMDVARVFVEEATIDRITVKHAHARIGAINDQMRTIVADASMEIYGIGYSFIDSIPYHYNDSVFHFDIGRVDVVLPDGLTRLHSEGLTARPGGVMHIDSTWVEARLDTNHHQFLRAGIDGLRIGGFDVQKFNQTKSLGVRSIHIDHPQATLRLSTKQQKKSAAEIKRERAAEQQMRQLQQAHWEELRQQAMIFLTEVNIDTIFLHDACADFASTTDHLHTSLDSLSLGVYGLGYSLLDSIPYHYNDSVYTFSIARAHVITPDSLIEVHNAGIRYTNGGALEIGRTRVHHTVGRWDLGPRKGNTPQAWIDLTMRSLTTSQKNVVREALTLGEHFVLDTVHVAVERMEIHKDARFPIREPHGILQQALLQIHYPFHIRRVNAQLDDMVIHLGKDTAAVGTMQLGPLQATISNITAVPNETIRVKAEGRMGKGDINLQLDMIVNRAGNWHMALDAKHLDMHHLDGFIYPIAGMRIGCDVSHLVADYGGDGQVATGTFCMEYTNLDVYADSVSPVKVVAKMSGLINSFAKTMLPHQNPIRPGAAPRAYSVKWKNDPWKEPALFYIGPVINGAVETMLPGIFAANRLHPHQPKTN